MRAKSQQPAQIFDSLSTSFLLKTPMPESEMNYRRLIWQESNEAAVSALKCYEVGNYKDAERLSKKSMDKAPLTPDGQSHQSNYHATQVLAMVYIRQEKYADSIKLYDDLFAQNPRSTYGSLLDPLNLALSSIRLGQYDKSLKYYQDYKKMANRVPEPSDPPASDYPGTDTPLKLEASILLERWEQMGYSGRSEGVIDLRRAHELIPDNPIIAFRLASHLTSDKDRAERIDLYKIVKENSKDKDMVNEAKYKISLLESMNAN